MRLGLTRLNGGHGFMRERESRTRDEWESPVGATARSTPAASDLPLAWVEVPYRGWRFGASSMAASRDSIEEPDGDQEAAEPSNEPE